MNILIYLKCYTTSDRVCSRYYTQYIDELTQCKRNKALCKDNGTLKEV